MNLDNPQDFKECLFAGGVFGRVFENETHGVYTPIGFQKELRDNSLLIATILSADPRRVTHFSIESLYDDKISFEETASYLICANRYLPSREFCENAHELLQ